MALLNLLQFLQTDDQATFVDKLNFNMDQILSMGGGPPGATGNTGGQGVPGQQGIQGFQGDPGEDGAYWFVQPSSVAPSVPTPKDGDLWLQTDNNNVLQYTGSPLTWTVVGNLSAPNQTGVVRSNGNIYVSGDEDGGGPGIDGDTILAYDSLLNEIRGNVRIHGDIITGITSPAGWIKQDLDANVVLSSNGTTSAANFASAVGAVLAYKIIGKTVHLNVMMHRFNNGTTGDSDWIVIKLPSALSEPEYLFEDGGHDLKASFAAAGTGTYRTNGGGGRAFGVECFVANSNDTSISGSFLGNAILAIRPVISGIGSPDRFADGDEDLNVSVTFEIQ